MNRRTATHVCSSVFWLLILILLPLTASAQVAPAPDAPPTASLSSNGQKTVLPSSAGIKTSLPQPVNAKPIFPPAATLRVHSNLVDVFFVARGPHHRLVTNLTKSDCSIFEDHVLQTIQSFSVHPAVPLTIGLLLDTSLSQENVLATEKQAAITFLRGVLHSKDEAFVLSFDVDVDQLAGLSGDLYALEQAIAGAGINSNSENFANGTIPPIGAPKATLLYDAVYLASNQALREAVGRKVLVLFTNGQDEGSRESVHNAIEAAQKADAVVYVLLMVDAGPYAIDDFSDTGPIHKIAKETGGRVFQVGHNGRKLETAFAAIDSDLRNEYEASYVPSNAAQDGTYRHIHVACRENGKQLHVQAKNGYYALASK